jgi:hypothetical protein
MFNTVTAPSTLFAGSSLTLPKNASVLPSEPARSFCAWPLSL